MTQFKSQEEYFFSLEERGALPVGFRISSIGLEFFPVEKHSETPYRMNLSLLCTDEPTSVFGAMFTRNQFPGAPVLIGRELLKEKQVQGVVVNNRISNVCAPNGVASAKAVASAVEKRGGFPPHSIFPSSTGIIGWRIPEKEMIEAVPRLFDALHGGTGVDLAKAIMTTDSFPKLRAKNIGEGRIVAVAKGAGMIEPNLATMLCFVMTDITVSRELLQEALQEAVEKSFNRISIDSDQSTSDSVIMLSSCKKGEVGVESFKTGLCEVLRDLANDVVRNGEGTAHVMRIEVEGFETDQLALEAGKAIANSPLVKTAIFGNDPNVGRLLSSLGDFCGNKNISIDEKKLQLFIGEEVVYSEGGFLLDEKKEDRIFSYLKNCELASPSAGYPEHDRCVDIKVVLPGKGKASVLGSDLSYEYIRENAEYRS